MFGGIGNNLDAGFAIRESDEGESAGFVDDGLGTLVVGEAVRDGNVAMALGVDARHLAAEEFAVGGGVLELVDGDEIMNHLMKDSVLDEFFGQVNADINAEDEVLVLIATEEALLAASESQLAEEALGMGKADGNRGKLPTEKAGVVGIKMGLYVRNRGDQFMIYDLRS